MKQTYIFDIDGTLADVTDRLHHLEGSNEGKWDRFYKDCGQDKPIDQTVNILNAMWYAGYNILFYSGRTETVRDMTIDWLDNHTAVSRHHIENNLFMRGVEDYRKDYIIKKEWFEKLGDLKHQILGVFEDRRQVVDMWRANGVTCYEVTNGAY